MKYELTPYKKDRTPVPCARCGILEKPRYSVEYKITIEGDVTVVYYICESCEMKKGIIDVPQE